MRSIVRTAALAAVSEANNAKHCELAMHPASHQEKSIAARQRCPTLKSSTHSDCDSIRESGLMKLENSNARSYLFLRSSTSRYGANLEFKNCYFTGEMIHAAR